MCKQKGRAEARPVSFARDTRARAPAREGATAAGSYAASLCIRGQNADKAKDSIRGAGDAAADTTAKMQAAAVAQEQAKLAAIAEKIRNVATMLRDATGEVERFSTRRISTGDKEAALDAIRRARPIRASPPR